MKQDHFLFWQPKSDILRFLNRTTIGRIFIIIFNYSIWLFLFYLSLKLIKHNPNIFWQLFAATLIGEIVEKYGKSHALWRRPLFQRHDSTPMGLVDSWYKTGSFPSGHTIKATYFFLFLLQYQVFNQNIFLTITLPLLLFRILIGFHYPIDMLGGAIVGTFIWYITHQIAAPPFMTEIVHVIFNSVFFINH